MHGQSHPRQTRVSFAPAVGSLILATLVAPLAAKEPAPKPSAPAADGPVRVIRDQGFRLELDLRNQVLGIYAEKERDLWREDATPREGDLVEVRVDGAELRDANQVVGHVPEGRKLPVVRVGKGWLLTAARLEGRVVRGWIRQKDTTVVGHDEALRPTIAGLARSNFMSHAVMAQKAKQFDDGLYAAVEYAAQDGAGKFNGKASLLAGLGKQLAPADVTELTTAAGLILGAGKLGGVEVAVPEPLQEPLQQRVDAFLADPLHSKPMGFYTWSDRLRAIFRQDRMLQTPLKEEEAIRALVAALAEDPKSRSTYNAYLELVTGLTNPLAHRDLRELLAAADRDQLSVPPNVPFHFFPPSRAHETDLVMRLYGNRVIPDGFNLADELIKRIRSGEIDLTPTDASGWYDYQTWSQEPMVIPDKMPEARRLSLNEAYREYLEEVFKGVLALTRETHVKQLEFPAPSEEAPPFGPKPRPKTIIRIYPELSAEPLATYYLRRAVGYRFVRGVLEKAFGPEALAGMHRQTAGGPVEKSLDEELSEMEALFFGAYVTVCRQLGMEPSSQYEVGTAAGPEADAQRFRAWTATAADDPDVGRDCRMMVPVFYDLARRKTKVWALLGWTPKSMTINFKSRPAVTVFDGDGARVTDDRVELRWQTKYATLACPVVAEVYVDEILDRDEFRAHCDKYKTRSAILQHLR